MGIPLGAFIFLMVLAGLVALFVILIVTFVIWFVVGGRTHHRRRRGYCGTMAVCETQRKANERQQQLKKEDQMHNTPAPLPGRRARALTEPTRALEQRQSALFRLPPEIRNDIYGLALGGTLHICRLPKRLGYIRFSPASASPPPVEPHLVVHHPSGAWRLEYVQTLGPGIYEPRFSQIPNRPQASCDNLLALSKACRRLYLEATPALYAHNTFDFTSRLNFLHLAATLLPHRLRALRALSFTSYAGEEGDRNIPPHLFAGAADRGRASWERTWDVLASLPRLHSLHVRLVGWDQCGNSVPYRPTPMPRGQEEALLAPARKVRVRGEFVLVLDWDSARDDEGGTLPEIEGPFCVRRQVAAFHERRGVRF